MGGEQLTAGVDIPNERTTWYSRCAQSVWDDA
jgi:hypothetical protein